jgi:glutathione synthase
MNILFITDPLDEFKTHKDSSFAMMREAAKRGHSLAACELWQLRWSQAHAVPAEQDQTPRHAAPVDGAALKGVVADVKNLTLASTQPPLGAWYKVQQSSTQALASFDAVVMRKDPPFDAEYFYATHLLQQAEREGAKVFNSPQALRDHPEKLALMEFSQYAAPTLVSRDMARLKAFHAQQQDVIFKPLDGMGGTGIFRVKDDALNLGAVIESLTANGTQSIMAQRYLPAIAQGDKRVLLIGGKPVPYCLARIPQGGEVRGKQ